ncbi:hypothetical protein [Campylobacter concisus]|uniref:hypothetical protein n=1 Tax=Campylobacter concisus TaxID=199 RepID=UPI00122CC414|nr:hypothetical protein [Campylobacter concisus]
MKILFLFLISFIYVFGDAVYPSGYIPTPQSTRDCTVEEKSSCPAASRYCKIDKDNLKHCISYYTKGIDVYFIIARKIPIATNPYKEDKISGFTTYNQDYDLNNNNNLKKREKASFKRVIGDMDVIGASVIKPVESVGGYSFDPEMLDEMDGEDGLTKNSSVVKKEFVQEDSSLFSPIFQNSSRATFIFDDKSNYERDNIDGSKVKYARLYWGGSIYKPASTLSGFNKLADEIYGFSRVNFKTPKGSYVVQAEKDDVKWFSSASDGYPNDGYSSLVRSYSTKYASAQHHGARGADYIIYQASADVTKEIKESLGRTSAERTFAVGGIASSIEKVERKDNYEVIYYADYPPGDPQYPSSRHNYSISRGAVIFADGKWQEAYIPPQFGGWSLVIVYDFEEEGERKGIEPKAINIYDGMANIYPGGVGVSKAELTFDGFYTPPSGDKKSTLALFSFGGRKEVKGDDVAVKPKQTSTYKSVGGAPLNPENPKGNQFNSSIGRFKKPADTADTYKKFNGQMDLDLFDISDKMDAKQTEMFVQFQVTGEHDTKGNFHGERQNIGMVAFSTLLYDPKVCYTEKLEVSRDKGASWIPVKSKDSSGEATIVKKGSLVRTTVTVENGGSEDAYGSILRVNLKPEFMSYKDTSTNLRTSKVIISADASPYSENWTTLTSDTNENLNRIDSQTLEYKIGKNASHAVGGELTHGRQNYARVQFIGVIEKEYKKTRYEAKFQNSNAGLKFDDRISECTPTSPNLKIVEEEENDFYPRSKKDDNSNGDYKNRLFTKIAKKPFSIYITNYSEIDGKAKAPDSPTDVDLKLVENCSSENSVLGHPVTLHFASKDTEEVKVTVPRPYRKLHVKLKYHSKPKNQDVVKCEVFDAFAVRPAMFQLYDKSGSGGVYNGSSVLVGGKDYKDITLAAYNMDKTTLANGYTNTLIAGSSVTGVNRYTENNVSILPVDKAGCIITEDTKKRLSEDNKLKIAFDNPAKAVGTITNLKTNKEGFSFSDIGNAKFYVVDKSYTSIDKKTPPQDSDCVLDKSDNNENTEGKVGCDIEFGEKKFGFEPNDLEVSEFKILPRGISYIANESSASFTPILSFKVKARLFDDNPALLYKDGCYSNNTRFKIKVGEMINGYTDNNGTLLKNDTDGLAKLNSEILFFGNLDASKVEKVHPASLHEGLFEVKKEAFKGGYADVNLKFNFKREKNMAKNPFEVTSDTFTFESLVDANKTKNNGNYKKPTTKTSAKFYYARTYAPYYEGPNTGFKAKIYYGVYCNGCDESKFMLQKPGSSARWEEFAGTHSWYVNPLHDASYGNVDSYDFSNHTTRDTAKETALSDGISYIYVKNDRAVTDIAKMHTKNWLIYNEFDKDAATNDFTVRFLVPNGDWAGKTLKSGSSKGDVGNVIGGENNFNDLSDKTNRRISW